MLHLILSAVLFLQIAALPTYAGQIDSSSGESVTFAAPIKGTMPDQDPLSMEMALDSYTEALYSMLIELQNQMVSDADRTIIKGYLDVAAGIVLRPKYKPLEVTRLYQQALTELNTLGAQGCLRSEFGLMQIEEFSRRYLNEPSQKEILGEVRKEAQFIRTETSCLMPRFESGKGLNLAANFTYLSELLTQGVRLHSQTKLQSGLISLFNVYLANVAQGIADSHFFNVNRIQKQFADAGIPFQNIEEVKSAAYKQVILSKAKVTGLFLGGLGGFLAAFFGSGRVVEEGIAASAVAAKAWNRVGSPLLSRATGGRILGLVNNFEKASYVVSSSFIGALGGASVQSATLAAETFKEAAVVSFAKDSTLGAELIPAIEVMMNKKKVAHAIEHGAKVGSLAGAMLTFGVFEYNLPKPLPHNLIRHGTLVLLASAVVFSTTMSGWHVLEHIAEGRKHLAESGTELLKLNAEMTPFQRVEILRRAKSLKVMAYDEFGEAALAGLDLAILMVLFRELFIRGEIFHIWNAHESEVVNAVATGSDEVPSAANNVAQAVQGGGGANDSAAKAGKLLGDVADDTAQIVGSKAGKMADAADDAAGAISSKAAKVIGAADDAANAAAAKGTSLKSVIANTGAVSVKTGTVLTPVAKELERINKGLDPDQVTPILPEMLDEE